MQTVLRSYSNWSLKATQCEAPIHGDTLLGPQRAILAFSPT